ncbi:MAG TPA: CrcB family protein [Elusimicrobiota bacterium]|nr:CrcB family protein [Elusimicrobiota bacterium]
MLRGLMGLIIGSVAGGLGRYAVTAGFARTSLRGFWATWTVNLAGCFLMGLFHAWAEVRFRMSIEQRLLLMSGFCGAFTTFSAFALDTAGLIRGGHGIAAAAYVASSVVLGLGMFYAGAWVGR